MGPGSAGATAGPGVGGRDGPDLPEGSGALVRTVLGDVPASELGVCYSHEHLILEASYVTERHPEFLLNDVGLQVEELRAFRAAGGRALVDSMPCDAGRNVVKLAELSRRSGVHVLCPTGLHLPKYYPQGHWGGRLGVDRLAELFISDIEQGVDANDYGGPEVERTGHRAGLIKIATGAEGITAQERRVFEAAAIAQLRTGAPILTHTEQGLGGLEQVDLLQGFGVRPERLVLSHTDRVADSGYHRELLSRGVFLEFDSAFRWKGRSDNPTLALVLELAAAGFGERLLLGMDAARRGYWRCYGGAPGLTFLLLEFTTSLLAAGLARADWLRIFVENPRRAFAFG